MIGAIMPLVLLVALLGASGWSVARGVAARDEAAQVLAETVDLSELEADADAESVAAERLVQRIDKSFTEVLASVDDVGAAQNAVIQAERDLVAAADVGIDQLNAGDVSAGKATFTTDVSAAADNYDQTLTALRRLVDAASDVIAGLDATLEAQP